MLRVETKTFALVLHTKAKIEEMSQVIMILF